MPGFPQLTPGKKALGRVYDIKHKFVEFSGGWPHAATPIKKGRRISLVYYSALGWESSRKSTKVELISLGFPLPDYTNVGGDHDSGSSTMADES